jgi:LPS-assembly protein
MPSQNLPRRLLCAAILAAIGSQPAVAATLGVPKTARPLSCPDTPALPMPASSLTPEDTDDDRVYVYADRMESKLNESTRFSGNVELRRDGLHLFADEAVYNQADNTLDASGHIHLRKDSGETVVTPLLRYELDTERGAAEDAQFAFAAGTARGAAKRIRFEGRDALTLESVRYTTCPPGQDDWFLRASELTLDKASETGVAWNASISFMQVPIFYSPYLSFPLTEARKSGLLAPHIGHSSNSGFILGVPYYFNLAPHYDDTLTLRALAERGTQALNEFRYLGKTFSGKLDLEYLPNDRVTDTDREALFFRHTQTLSPRWRASTDIQWVSDNSYFIDLGATTTDSGRTHLPRSVRLDYGGSVWRFSARAFTYQTLDTTILPADQPYQRLPQLVLTADSPSGPNRLHSSLEGEWVNFYRQDSVTGQRFDLQPGVSLPLRTSYFYFTPKAAYRYTSWHLDNTGTDESPDRGLPIYSLDSGLALEREGRFRGQAYAQTLEPRVYYVYIPYKNQDSLPVFDAALPAFSFYNFFRENRFVGADRVGDANQVTAAITSRILLPGSGVEQARVSLGQVQYFSDQQVNLPAGTVTQTRSDLIGEVYARLGQAWYLRGGLQWDNKERDTRKSSFYLHYRPEADRILNLGYRYTNDLEELVDISTQWPLSTRWTGVARWNYSLPESRTVQAYAGLQYTSCCWAVRAAAHQRQQPDGSVDNSLLFELELSGFAKMGETEESPLKQGKFIFE